MNRTQQMMMVCGMCAVIPMTGCQVSNLLGRNDYRAMHDPFVDSPATAIAGNASLGSGVARTRATEAARPATADYSRPEGQLLTEGPKPIPTRSELSAANRSLLSEHAVYPGASGANGNNAAAKYPGPALSDFLSDSSTELAPEPAPAVTADLADFSQFVSQTNAASHEQKAEAALPGGTVVDNSAAPAFDDPGDINPFAAQPQAAPETADIAMDSPQRPHPPASPNPFAGLSPAQGPGSQNPFVNPFAAPAEPSPGDAALADRTEEAVVPDSRDAANSLDFGFRGESTWKPIHHSQLP